MENSHNFMFINPGVIARIMALRSVPLRYRNKSPLIFNPAINTMTAELISEIDNLWGKNVE